MIHVLYRISNNSYSKVRLDNATKKNCLLNAITYFNPKNNDLLKFHLFADGINDGTGREIDEIIMNNPKIIYTPIKGGSGAASFNIVLDYALTLPDDDVVYFLEDDYVHNFGSFRTLSEMVDMGTDYGTLYLCPDKFIAPSKGGNPYVDEDGGYPTKVYRGKTQMFMMSESTTMTFFAKVKTLREDEDILRHFTTGSYPDDFKMFLKLREKGRILLYPLITKSTHAEKAWLAPIQGLSSEELLDWWEDTLNYEL
jgi:hypothetical protein